MDLNSLLFLAQAAERQPSMLDFVIPFGLMAIMFYFLIIRPQKKRANEHRQLVESLKKGQKVVTAGGIHGIITNVKDTTVIVKVDDATKLEVEKASVERVNVGTAEETAAPAPQAKTS